MAMILIKPYGWFMLVGILASLGFWARLARRDGRLMLVYAAALVGAFLGAKIVYILAEGWRDFVLQDVWERLATGKSILGALLGGYAAVEWAKRFFDYETVTGDWFATIVPFGVMIGRVGCWIHGCCHGVICSSWGLGVSDGRGGLRWPAVPVELGFNAVMILVFLWLRRSRRLSGQHFHVYLISYGLFRFCHEFLRDTPRLLWGLSGYQTAAAGVAVLGLVRFRQRAPKTLEIPLSLYGK